MKFSEVLRNLAEDRNLTQKRLAADLGIPVSTIGGYFQGTSEPDLETVKRLAGYFGCSVDYLLGNKSQQTITFKEDTLLRLFRSMDDNQQTLFVELGKTIINITQK